MPRQGGDGYSPGPDWMSHGAGAGRTSALGAGVGVWEKRGRPAPEGRKPRIARRPFACLPSSRHAGKFKARLPCAWLVLILAGGQGALLVLIPQM